MKNIINKKAFSFIEVMTVVIILGILAAIALLVMETFVKKAVLREAIVALGTIREAQRVYLAEYGHYADTFEDLGFRLKKNGYPSDLDGTYFSEECYFIGGKEPRIYIYSFGGEAVMLIQCVPSDAARVPRASYARKLGNGSILMSHKGEIFTSLKGMGFPPLPVLYPVPDDQSGFTQE